MLLIVCPPMSSHVLLQGQDEEVEFQEDDDRREVFSRRKLETNWDRYEESERQEPEDDMPAQRGADYHVLLESAGKTGTWRAGGGWVCFACAAHSGGVEWRLWSVQNNQIVLITLNLLYLDLGLSSRQPLRRSSPSTLRLIRSSGTRLLILKLIGWEVVETIKAPREISL